MTLVIASGGNSSPSLPGMGPHSIHQAGRLTDQGKISFLVNSAGANASLPKPHPFSDQVQVFDYNGFYIYSGGSGLDKAAVYDGNVTVDVGNGQMRTGVLVIDGSSVPVWDSIDSGETVFEAGFISKTLLPAPRDDFDQFGGIFSVKGGTIKLRVLHFSFVGQDDPAVPVVVTWGDVFKQGENLTNLKLNTAGQYALSLTNPFILPELNDRVVVNGTDLQGLSDGGTSAINLNDSGSVAHIRGKPNPRQVDVYVGTSRLFGEGDVIPGVGTIRFLPSNIIAFNNRGDVAVDANITNLAGVEENVVIARSASAQYVGLHMPPGASPRLGGDWALNNNGTIVLVGGSNGLQGTGRPQFQVLQLDFANGAATPVAQYFMADLFPNTFQSAPIYASINASNAVAFTIRPPDNEVATYLLGPKSPVDLDIDTLNRNGLEPTFGTAEEDAVEDLTTDPTTGQALTGKLIATNHFDKNFNSAPDFADGWSFSGNPTVDTQQNLYERFVPMKLTLPPGANAAAAKITFQYSFSDPLSVTFDGGQYIPSTSGRLRIWNKVGHLPRLPQDLDAGGNIVAPGVAYSAEKLGFKNGITSVVLWLEAVGEILVEREGPRHIIVDCDPGNGDPATQDDVLVSVTDCPPPIKGPQGVQTVDTTTVLPGGETNTSTWSLRYAISEKTGLTFYNVLLEKRMLADQMSVAPVVIQLPGGVKRYIPLVADSGENSSPRCRLADFRLFMDGNALVVGASYAIDKLPEGGERCLLVTQRYSFHKLDPDEDVEPGRLAPFPYNLPSIMLKKPLRAARFKPVASYAYHGPDDEAPDYVEVPQFNHFKPDGAQQNNLIWLRDDDVGPQISKVKVVGRSWVPVPDPSRPFWGTLWVKIPYEIYLDENPLLREVVISAVAAGGPGDMDNFHFTNHPEIDEPLPPPGCPECIHVHWRWGAWTNYPIGHPPGQMLIPMDKQKTPRKQHVDVGISSFHANEDSMPQNWRGFMNGESVKNNDSVLWYAGYVEPLRVPNRAERRANGFFTHGGTFAPTHPPKPQFGDRTLNGPKDFEFFLRLSVQNLERQNFKAQSGALALNADPVDLSKLNVFWALGDGTVIDWHSAADPGALEVRHAYSQAGDYVVMAFIEDEFGIWSAAEPCLITVTDDTIPPPVANAGTDRSVEQDFLSGSTVTLDGSASTGDSLSYLWSGPFGTVGGVSPTVSLPLGTSTLQLIVTDPAGQTSAAIVHITVQDTVAPTLANVPGNVTVEQTGLAGTPVNLTRPTATDVCDAAPTVGGLVPAVFPLGTTVITWTAIDASGNSSTATTTVTVRDTAPPVIASVAATPSLLTAPSGGDPQQIARLQRQIEVDQRLVALFQRLLDQALSRPRPIPQLIAVLQAALHGAQQELARDQAALDAAQGGGSASPVPVTVSVSASDVCDAAPVSQILSITNSQSGDVLGGGVTSLPWGSITGNLSATLLPARTGGVDRIYTITVRCIDASGNSATRSTQVTVVAGSPAP